MTTKVGFLWQNNSCPQTSNVSCYCRHPINILYIYIYIYDIPYTYSYTTIIYSPTYPILPTPSMVTPELPCWVDQIEGQANFRISRLRGHIFDQVSQPRPRPLGGGILPSSPRMGWKNVTWIYPTKFHPMLQSYLLRSGWTNSFGGHPPLREEPISAYSWFQD